MGRNGGAGNPPSWQGFATAYLWERIWTRDSVLNLVQQFVQVIEDLDDKGKKTGKKHLIFPRYHQLDAVRRLLADAYRQGRATLPDRAQRGKRQKQFYLLAGTPTLGVARCPGKRVFDSIIVVTDRRVLNRQLQQTVQQFEQTLGVVENIDITSGQLREALENGKTIIVTTLQKFPVIVQDIETLQGKRFAVIIDEAHSSQSGESTSSLKKVLTVGTLDDADIEESNEGEDLEDRISDIVKRRGRLPNVSFFAFTATPKPKTLELFGTRQRTAPMKRSASIPCARQLKKSFILDVLEHYTTYKTYWSLLKKVEDDPHYDRSKASLLLKSFVDIMNRPSPKK